MLPQVSGVMTHRPQNCLEAPLTAEIAAVPSLVLVLVLHRPSETMFRLRKPACCYESSLRGGKSLRLRFSFADQLQGWGHGTAGETSFWRSGTPMMLMMPGAGAGGGGGGG